MAFSRESAVKRAEHIMYRSSTGYSREGGSTAPDELNYAKQQVHIYVRYSMFDVTHDTIYSDVMFSC